MIRAAAAAPSAATSLVGRRAELGAIRRLLADRETRILTLTGPGGVGKTRLALAAARELAPCYRDGVHVASLAPLSDPTLALNEVARTLGLAERPGRTVEEILRATLSERELLLCLDNFEHLLEAAPLVAGLLATSPGLTVLATSRASLRVSGERVYEVPPLAPAEAESLFLRRAQSLRGELALTGADREAISEICLRLDCLPLAIELAAARVRVLSPGSIRSRLDASLDLLAHGPRDAPARQQTLRATLDWSYELLDDAERRVLERLATFPGGTTLAAAEEACAADVDTLASLVEQSLVRTVDGGNDERRYTLLETVRAYALERLDERGDALVARRRQARYVGALVEEAGSRLEAPDALVWLDRLDRESDNIRAALEFLEADDPASFLAATVSLFRWWTMRSRIVEGARWLDRALARDDRSSPRDRSRALAAAAYLIRELGGDGARRALPLAEEAVDLCRALGDEASLGRALNVLGAVFFNVGDLDRSREIHERGLTISRRAGDVLGVARALNDLGTVAGVEGDFELAARRFEESLELHRSIGSVQGTAWALSNLGTVAARLGDDDRARELLRESVAATVALDAPLDAAYALDELVRVELRAGRAGRAARLYGWVEAAFEAVGPTAFPDQETISDDPRSVLLDALGADGLASACAAGRAMSFDEIVADAFVDDPGPGTPAVVRAPREGDRLGGFLLEELVARGGMGVVFRARDEESGREVALKVLAPDLAARDGFRERFLREARVAASLVHEGLLPVESAGEDGGVLFLATRYVDGEDLAALLAREGRLAPARALELLAHVAAALDAAHEAGLVHRDVKPGNVLVEGERAFVTDFGLAKPVDSASVSLTRTDQLLGTVDYLAPEQIQVGAASPRSDVYALGCVLFEVLTGRVPYPRASEVATLWAHVTAAPPSARELEPSLPPALDPVVARALAKTPEERYESAGALIAAARAALVLR